MKVLGNRGQTVAMAWIYVITMIFSVGMVYLTLDQIVRVTLYQLAITLGANADLLSIIVYVWGVLPLMWIGAAILYGIVYTIRRGGEGDYYA